MLQLNFVCGLVVLLATASSVAYKVRVDIPSPPAVTANEAYLLPYNKELVDFRTNPIAKQYIELADLIDALPTFIFDMLIPLFIPGSELTIPLNITIPLKAKVGPVKIPLPATITLINVTFTDLDEFKTLRPAEILPGGLYTWGGVIEMANSTLTMTAKLEVLGHDVYATAAVSMREPAIDFAAIFAYQRSRLCDVWGAIMRSSKNCAVWPFFMDESTQTSGVNITELGISVSDFNFTINVTGLGDALDVELADELEKVLATNKPTIIAHLNTTISNSIREAANTNIFAGIVETQRTAPCVAKSVTPMMNLSYIVNISEVCIVNDGGYDLSWSLQDCPANTSSPETGAYPIDQKRCMDVATTVPNVKPGDTLRINTHAIAGLREISDPIFHYSPDSNGAAFECAGTTLIHSCKLVSIAPVDPAIPAPASSVCIINQAGFDMNFHGLDVRTGAETASSGTYPIDQTQCVKLSTAAGSQVGDQFKIEINAVAGNSNQADRVVEYQDNGLTATYQCEGTTLDYHCELVL